MSIIIDEEFQNLIPPLSAEEYTQLEKNCVKDGIRDPLVVWPQSNGDNILVDGHNRWNISANHGGIQFEIRPMMFESREAVKEWIIKNQLGRRNIPPYVRAELALKLKPVIAEKAKERMLNPLQNSAQGTTRDQIAKAAGVSHDTIHKVEKIQEKASPEAKEALRRGDMSINAVYSGIIASENEDRRQRENRELREAIHRAEDYQSDDGKIADFGKVKQHKEDNKLIFNDFAEDVRKMLRVTRQVSMSMDLDFIRNSIQAASNDQLEEINKQLTDCYRIILKVQKNIVEVMDEK